jgi:hypothetical protein
VPKGMLNLKRAFKNYNKQEKIRIIMCDLAKKATLVLKELHNRPAMVFGKQLIRLCRAAAKKEKLIYF